MVVFVEFQNNFRRWAANHERRMPVTPEWWGVNTILVSTRFLFLMSSTALSPTSSTSAPVSSRFRRSIHGCQT